MGSHSRAPLSSRPPRRRGSAAPARSRRASSPTRPRCPSRFASPCACSSAANPTSCPRTRPRSCPRSCGWSRAKSWSRRRRRPRKPTRARMWRVHAGMSTKSEPGTAPITRWWKGWMRWCLPFRSLPWFARPPWRGCPSGWRQAGGGSQPGTPPEGCGGAARQHLPMKLFKACTFCTAWTCLRRCVSLRRAIGTGCWR